MFYLFLKIFILPIIKLIWVKNIEGLENIPKKDSFIIASNHESYFDFITLYTVTPRRIYFLAGEVFFRKWQWAWLVKLTKQIKVDRSAEDKSESVNQALNYLKNGKVIGIFPEGTRSKDGELRKAYNGAVKLAIYAKVPIIPVGIKGTFEIMSRHDKYPKFKKCELNFGQLIYYNYNKQIIGDRDKVASLTRDLMKKIGLLCGEEYEF